MTHSTSSGPAAPAVEALAAEFARNFAERGDLGAAVSVWAGGREVASLAGGFQDREKTRPWTAATPVLFWSATKGPAAACVLHACAEAGLALSRQVAEFWPEFAAQGKGAITIAELMSHQAGLSALSRGIDVFDYDAIVAALAAEAPHWPLGSGHGYHPRTFGYLLDEFLRRLAGGTTLGAYWQATFARPLGLDLWIGVPETMVEQVAPIHGSRTAPPKGDPFYSAFLTAGSVTARTFSSPRGLHTASSMNTPEARMASLPAFGGIGTASALAKFYAMLAQGGALDGRRYFQPETVALMSTPLVEGPDLVLQTKTAFSAGFMQDPLAPDGRKLRQAFGPSRRAFGHPGAGGSHAFADPENGVAFAYVMNQMQPGVLPDERSVKLVEAIYRATF
ncbi:MAG TPA: serine hydrolase domain-containing protein [Chthoniobacteraceae bacterium]|nr:serine hydrolase domain-containing protein [Chthoniobacteraceae bacterium]